MFRNREFRVRLAKIDPEDDEAPFFTALQIDSGTIIEGAKDLVTHAATAIVGVYAARFVMITLHEVIVMGFEKKFR